jgi:hypothetical protein
MPDKNCDFDFNAFAEKYAGRVDLGRFIEGVTAVINDVVDAAMDGVLEAADAIARKVEGAGEGTGEEERMTSWRWRDDDDPADVARAPADAEAMR